ncbi:MAG: hypothetical protein RBT73_06760, partial [Spirochaetia bacterium]|nr:hypothetical protein [Spirochaetia bacterium]
MGSTKDGGQPESAARLGSAAKPDLAGIGQHGGLGKRLAVVGESVMIRHSLFSLPFAAAAVLLETG